MGPQPSYKDNGDGTVTDLNSGLMWQQGDSQNHAGGRTWQDALNYCECLTLPSGYSDWKLPNVRELETLVDWDRYDPEINPLFSCRSSHYWSSSTSTNDRDFAWVVHFNGGYVDGGTKTFDYSVRCVRGGPSGSFDNYPYKDFNCPDCIGVCCHLPDKSGDPWGFCIKNCTSYVAFRLNKVLGEGKFTNTMDGGRWGNGANWDNNVKNVKGFELATHPKAGDVAQWDNVACYDEDGKTICYGHVAYVEKVNSDGTILVSEYNWPSESNGNTSCTYGQRTISAATPSHFIRATLTTADTADYVKLDDGAAVTERTELTENVDLAPSGNIFVKIWNWIKGLVVGTDNTESSAAKNMSESTASSTTFEFSTPVTEVIAYIADFGGGTTFAAYNNSQALKTISITNSVPEFYIIADVGAISKVVISSTSAWVGPVTSSITLYVESSGSCGGRKPCYKTIQEAMNDLMNGSDIQVALGTYPEAPTWTKTGTVTLSGGWATDFSAKDGTTSMYAPKATGGGGVKVQPNVKIIAP